MEYINCIYEGSEKGVYIITLRRTINLKIFEYFDDIFGGRNEIGQVKLDMCLLCFHFGDRGFDAKALGMSTFLGLDIKEIMVYVYFW
jgi:hypothetical protein